MLWIYARGEESLRLEIRFDKDTEEFVLIFYEDDGRQRQIERFTDAIAFRSRLVAVEKQLGIEGWHFRRSACASA